MRAKEHGILRHTTNPYKKPCSNVSTPLNKTHQMIYQKKARAWRDHKGNHR
jgi:hypothetical protein